MKQNLWLSLMLLATFLISNSLCGQQPKWYMPPIVYDMSTASPTPAGTTTNSFSAAQSVYGPDGNMIFYINNKNVYTGPNWLSCTLPDFYSVGTDINGNSMLLAIQYSQMIVVPVPSVCNKYYVIYALYGSMGTSGVFSVVLDVSSGTPQIDPSSLENPPGLPGVPTGHKNPKQICLGGTFAVSKTINGANERYFFGYTVGKLNKYKISSSGITLVSEIMDFAAPYANYYPPAIELSADQKYIATCPGINGNDKLYQVQLNSSYDSVPGTLKSVNLGYRPVGIQYDAASTNLFVTGGTSGISWHSVTDITSGAFTQISGTGSYSISSLEMGKTGSIYAIQQSTRKLAYITTSMPSPTLTSTNIIVNSSGGGPNLDGYGLPSQIDGEDYSDFIPNPTPVNNYSINGTASGNTPSQFLNVYTCSNITLNNTSTGAAYYTLFVQSCDQSGNITTGPGTFNYFTISSSPYLTSIDLKSLPDATPPVSNWLADPAHIGYYKVSFQAVNFCGQNSAPKFMYLKLNSPPSAANINLKINNGSTGISCMNKTIGTACPVGIYSVTYNIGAPGTTFATNNIDSYSRKIEEVDCSTGNILSVLYEDTVPVIANGTGAATGLSLNAIPINGTPGYFATNPVIGKCYKFTLTAYNACSSASDWSFLKFDGYYKNELNTAESVQQNNKVKVFPVPAKDILNIEYRLDQSAKVKIQIYDMQGILQINDENLPGNKGINRKELNISKLTTGVYIYQLSIDDKTITGRITKI